MLQRTPWFVAALLLTSAAPAAAQDAVLPVEVVREFTGPKGYVNCVAFSPDGTLVAAAARFDGVAYVWQTGTGREVCKLTGGPKAYNTQLAFAADGRSVAWEDGGDRAGDAVVRVFEVGTGKLLRQFKYNQGGSQHHNYGTAFSTGARWFASANVFTRKTMDLWDVAKGQLLRQFEQADINSVAIAANDKLLASQNSSGLVRVWQPDGKMLHEMQRVSEGKFQGAFTLLAFSPDAKYLAASGHGSSGVTVWDAVAGKQLHYLELDKNNSPATIVFSADGRLVGASFGVGGAQELHFWKVATGEKVGVMREKAPRHFSETGVTFSPEGVLLAAGGMNNVWLYAAAKGKEQPLLIPVRR